MRSEHAAAVNSSTTRRERLLGQGLERAGRDVVDPQPGLDLAPRSAVSGDQARVKTSQATPERASAEVSSRT